MSSCSAISAEYRATSRDFLTGTKKGPTLASRTFDLTDGCLLVHAVHAAAAHGSFFLFMNLRNQRFGGEYQGRGAGHW